MLTKNDLKSIKELVKEIVVESEERINAATDVKIEMLSEKFEDRFDGVERSIDDLIEINQAFIEKFDDHEKRIVRLETKLKTA